MNTLHQFDCGMFIKALDGTYVWANEVLLKRHRLTLQALVGRKDNVLPWALHAHVLCRHDEAVLDLKKTLVFKETITRMGKTIKGFSHKSPSYNENGTIVGIAGIFFDAPNQEDNLYTQLSIREQQCLINMAAGLTAAESALKLRLSRRTVEGYIEQLRLKLQCKNKAELLAFYYEYGQ